jgi:predicted nuclease of predicted toxin-antitoxin system
MVNKVLKFLADVNVEKSIVDYLLETGYDVKWIPDYDCGIDDEDLLTIANEDQRVLITNDKDFGELIFFHKKHSAGIILIRVKEQQTEKKLELIRKLLMIYEEKILNHFTVITKTNFRFVYIGGIND